MKLTFLSVGKERSGLFLPGVEAREGIVRIGLGQELLIHKIANDGWKL